MATPSMQEVWDLGDILDEIDSRIIEELRRDGRQANTEIARTLGVGEAMVRHRIRRLITKGIIQVIARVNLSRLGYDVHVVIGVVCDGGGEIDIAQVADEVAALPEVRYASYVTGRCDLLVMASFPSQQEFFTFLTQRLRKIPGVARTETLYQMRVIKRNYNYWGAD